MGSHYNMFLPYGLVFSIFLALFLNLLGFTFGIILYSDAMYDIFRLAQCVRDDDEVVGLNIIEWTIFDGFWIGAILVVLVRKLRTYQKKYLVSHLWSMGFFVIMLIVSTTISFMHYTRVAPCWRSNTGTDATTVFISAAFYRPWSHILLTLFIIFFAVFRQMTSYLHSKDYTPLTPLPNVPQKHL